MADMTHRQVALTDPFAEFEEAGCAWRVAYAATQAEGR